MMTIFRKPLLQVAFMALCTTALSALPAMAQEPTAPAAQDQAGPPHGGHDQGQREEHQIAFLTKKLNLTPDQVSQVKAIDDDSRQQMMALRNDTATPKADKRAKMMDIHKASQDKIRAVLTDDQKTKYDALQAEMRERRESHEGGQGTPPPPPPQ
jgi:periplasmic protein CpxP/Spy